MRAGVRRAIAFLAALVAVIAVSPSPARAATDPAECRVFAGSYDNETYLFACAIAKVTHPFGRTHVQLTTQVWTGVNFATGAESCASKIYGQFQNAAGTVWEIPQVAQNCSNAIYYNDSGLLTHLDSDTSATRVRLNFCLYWYYPHLSPNTMCKTTSGWQDIPS